MKRKILNLKVGEGIESNLSRAASLMATLEHGEKAKPYFGIGFGDVGQMFSVFTPRRWDLLATLRAAGPMTTAELARELKRDYKNVHNDVTKLLEWLVVEKDEAGRVFAPYAEIIVDVRMPVRIAA